MRPDLFYVMQGKLKISFEPVLSEETGDREDLIISLGDYIDPIKLAEYCTGSDIQDKFPSGKHLDIHMRRRSTLKQRHLELD